MMGTELADAVGKPAVSTSPTVSPTADTLYQYRVLLAMVVSAKVTLLGRATVLAATLNVVSPNVKPASNALSTMNPASLMDWSAQVNVTLRLPPVLPFHTAVSNVGAFGGTANTRECIMSISSC